MKGFVAGVIFTIVAESTIAIAVFVKAIKKGADEE